MVIFVGEKNKFPYGTAFYQYFSTASVALMITCSGMHYGWSSPSLEKLQLENSPIKITNSEGSWLAVMTLIGRIMGSIIFSTTVDFLGRKRIFLVAAPIYVITWIMIAYASSVNTLYAARFIAGCVNCLTGITSTMYTAEIAEPKIRGLLVSTVTVTWIIGILLVNIIGSYLSIYTTALVSIVIPTVSFICFYSMPESPYGLLVKGDYEGAKKSLQLFRGVKDVDAELDRICSAMNSQKTNQKGKYLDIFTVSTNRKAMIIAFILRIFQSYSGSNAISFYTQTIFRESGGSLSPAIASIIYISVQLVMSTLGTGIVDKTGRRPLLIISIFGSALALFVEGTYFLLKTKTTIDMDSYSYIALIALLAYIIIFSLGLQIVPSIVLGELFPANIKPFALCTIDISLSLAGISASKFFQIVKDNFGMFVPFYCFSSFCLLGTILICFLVPETKGQTLEDIQSNLGKKNKNDNKS